MLSQAFLGLTSAVVVALATEPVEGGRFALFFYHYSLHSFSLFPLLLTSPFTPTRQTIKPNPNPHLKKKKRENIPTPLTPSTTFSLTSFTAARL